jgi:hypothetical protein
MFGVPPEKVLSCPPAVLTPLQHLTLDFTKIIMLVEAKPPFSEGCSHPKTVASATKTGSFFTSSHLQCRFPG